MSSSIYDAQDNPYVSWLEVTTEKELFEAWLREHIPQQKIATMAGRHASILDIGCSWGSTSVRLMRVLRDIGIAFSYTGVDPSQSQLDQFAEYAKEQGVPTPKLITGGIEHVPRNRMYDLVLASHSLYYVDDIPQAIQRMAELGREIIIIHHGTQGINTLHEAFRELVPYGKHLISTDDELARCLESVDLGDRQVQRHRFVSTANIKSCINPESVQGRNLLTFFFERDIQTISQQDQERIHVFLQERYAPNFQMMHDDSIFLIS